MTFLPTLPRISPVAKSNSTSWLYVGTIVPIAFTVYALYFDRQRRHSSAFRARIEASKKKVAKIEDEEKQQKKRQGEKDTQRAIAIASSARKIPESQSDAEQIMMDHLSQGDGAQKRGDVVSAAAYYFLAIEVHPDQEQIITGLMQHVPVEIAQIIGGMMQKASQMRELQ